MNFHGFVICDKDKVFILLFCTHEEPVKHFNAGQEITILKFSDISRLTVYLCFTSLPLKLVYTDSQTKLVYMLATEAKIYSRQLSLGLFIAVVQMPLRPPGKVFELNGVPHSRLTVFHSLIREWEADSGLLGIFSDTKKWRPVSPFSPRRMQQRANVSQRRWNRMFRSAECLEHSVELCFSPY